ncbi:MAG: hypothetical protein ISS78_03930 [Phycisphaerae bacterium]|nr:hypothetical protein [Phycisphaerae bacterium]
MPKGCGTFLAAWIVLCAVAAPGQDKPKAPHSAYDSLDPSVLSAALRELQMREVNAYLLDQLERSGDPITVRVLKAEDLIHNATLVGVALDQRRELLNQAIALLRQVVAGTANPPDDKALIKHLEYKLKLAATAGLIRAEPYALRLAYLQGAEQDRRDVISLTAKASNLMIELENETNDLLVEWRADLEKLVTIVPPLRQLHSRVLYQAAWVYLYRGLALPLGPDKKQFLAMAQIAGSKSRRTGRNPYRSRLVQGIAGRALGRHGDADKHLSGLNTANVPTDVRIQAMFEAACNLAEEGKVEEALQAVDRLYKTGSKLLGESGKLQMELHSAILRSHVYEVQSARETMPKPKKALLDKALQVLVEVIQQHGASPEVRGTMFDIIAHKYGGDVDPGNDASVKRAHSVVLLALSVLRLKQKSGGARAFAEAVTMLKEVLGRKDPLSAMLRPDTMWYLALAYHELRDNVKAGQMFAKLAGEFPDHRLARNAAMNATATFRGIISERVEGKKPVPSSIRKRFVAALEVLLGNDRWVKQAEGQFYDLGWQYEKLATAATTAEEKLKLQQQAVEAYKKVPESNLKDYMDARHQALMLEVEIMASAKDVSLPAAEGLVERLTGYSARAKQEASKTGDKDLASDLTTWGSRAAFNVATVYYNHMDRETKAIEMLKALPGQWPQTPVLQESSEFLIRKLMEQGNTLAASKEVEEFTKKHPQRGSQLIDLVITNIRAAIKVMAKDPRMADKVAAYRKGYQHLAKLLYDNAAKDPNTTPQQLLDLKQMYADALAEGGKPEEALKLSLECKAEEDKKLKAERDRIDKDFDTKIKAMEAIAAKGPQALHQAITDVLEKIPKAPLTGEARAIVLNDGRHFTGEVTKTPAGYVVKINVVRIEPETKKPLVKIEQRTFAADQVALIVPKDATQPIALFKANIYLAKLLREGGGATTRATRATTTPAIKNRAEIDEVVILLLNGYDKLMNAQRLVRKNALQEDPANFWLLAKSYFALKQYFEALKYYSQLSRRIDPNRNPQRYWEAQLAYCRCALEAFRKVRRQLEEDPQKNREKLQRNTESLEGLRAFMRQLEQEDPRKGELYQEYNAIEAELRSLLESRP